MSAGVLLQALVAGLAAGAVYGLIGIGFSLIFRMSRVLNFAHGDLVSVAVFGLLFAAGGGAQVAASGLGWGRVALAAIVALVITVAVAAAIQRFAVAPFLARGSALGWIAATAAAGLVLRSLIALWSRTGDVSVPDVLPLGGLGRGGLIDLPGGGVLAIRDLVVLALALALALAFDRWLSASRTGTAMRAVADSRQASVLVGISPARMSLLAFAIAGVLAAIAGLMLAPARPFSLELGVILGLKGIAAAVLGRLGSARGALVAGVAIGVGESLLSIAYLPAIVVGGIRLAQLGPVTALHDIAAVALLVLLLGLAPGRLEVGAEQLEA